MEDVEGISDEVLFGEYNRRRSAQNLKYQEEWDRRRKERLDKLEASLVRDARNVLPDLTDEQIEQLKDVFIDYYEEIYN